MIMTATPLGGTPPGAYPWGGYYTIKGLTLYSGGTGPAWYVYV